MLVQVEGKYIGHFDYPHNCNSDLFFFGNGGGYKASYLGIASMTKHPSDRGNMTNRALHQVVVYRREPPPAAKKFAMFNRIGIPVCKLVLLCGSRRK